MWTYFVFRKPLGAYYNNILVNSRVNIQMESREFLATSSAKIDDSAWALSARCQYDTYPASASNTTLRFEVGLVEGQPFNRCQCTGKNIIFSATARERLGSFLFN